MGYIEVLRKRRGHDWTPIIFSEILQSRCCCSPLAPNRGGGQSWTPIHSHATIGGQPLSGHPLPMGDLPRGLKCPHRTKLYNMAACVILFDEVRRMSGTAGLPARANRARADTARRQFLPANPDTGRGYSPRSPCGLSAVVPLGEVHQAARSQVGQIPPCPGPDVVGGATDLLQDCQRAAQEHLPSLLRWIVPLVVCGRLPVRISIK